MSYLLLPFVEIEVRLGTQTQSKFDSCVDKRYFNDILENLNKGKWNNIVLIDTVEYVKDQLKLIVNSGKELLRSNIKSLPKYSTFKVVKNNGKRIINCNDDDLVTKEDKLSISIITQENNGIPKEIKTGISTIEKKIEDGFTLELTNFYENESQKVRDFTEMLLSLTNSMRQINNVYNLVSTDLEGYEGEIENNLPNGYGKRFRNRKFTYDDTLFDTCNIYEGFWKDGYFNGCGKLTYFNKDNEIESYYDCNFNMGQKEGYGIYFNLEKGTLEGNFKDDMIIGLAKMTYVNGDIYEGGWDFECRQGSGKMTCADGTIYEGEWVDDKKV